MPVTVVLAIGFDPWVFESQRTVWQMAGHFVTPAGSACEAIDHFRDGDFDAVLLGRSIPARIKEQIIREIRATGSKVPIVCVAEASSKCEACEFASMSGEPLDLMRRIEDLLAVPLHSHVPEVDSTHRAVVARARTRGFSRSGLRRRSERTAPVERVKLFPGADSPCFSICFRAAGEAGGGMAHGLAASADSFLV